MIKEKICSLSNQGLQSILLSPCKRIFDIYHHIGAVEPWLLMTPLYGIKHLHYNGVEVTHHLLFILKLYIDHLIQ